jgi:sugar phosphate isomerase/epimerase
MESKSRRKFIKKTALAAGIIPFMNAPLSAFTTSLTDDDQLSVHLFSKVLHFLDWEAAGKKAAQIGFSGLDLTVRPKGHVLPENVKTDLPKAIKAIQEAGSQVKMISTNIESVNRPLDVDIIRTAGKLGVEYYRPNWYEYSSSEPMEKSIERYKQEVKELSLLNKECNIIGSYQNRDGRSVGASFWEVKQILETCDTNYYGSQYDIRHAVVEGGFSWENGFRLLQPYINAIVLKDFKWGKVDGKWDTINTPVGEGMVDFDSYFKLLKKNNLKPPVSLHVEYPLGGAENGDKKITVAPEVVFDALQKDLETIQTLWKNA